MQRAFTAIFVLSLALFSSALYAEENKPKVLAVTFYADWCGSCAEMDPKVIKAREKFKLDKADVLFVQLDLTNNTRRHQAELLANALGIPEIFKKYSGATGFMLLIDAESGKELGRVLKTHDVATINARVKKAVQEAS